MSKHTQFPQPVKTWDFIRQLFEPADPVALLLLSTKTHESEQKIHSAGDLSRPAFQQYLRAKNAQGFNIHLGMNPLYAEHAIRLTMSSAMASAVKNIVNSVPSITNYKEEGQERTTSLTWTFRGITIANSKTQAFSALGNLQSHLAEIPNLDFHVFQQHRRLKENVREVRRLYLDLDHSGDEHLKRLFKDSEDGKLPLPNYVVNTSPGKYQVIWTVEPGSQQSVAEGMLRTMAKEYGGDPACSDVTRMLRLPGLHNKKYDGYTPVHCECWTNTEHQIADFAYIHELAGKHATEDHQQVQAVVDFSSQSQQNPSAHVRRSARPETDTQSHKDWHYCCREAEKTIYRSPETLVAQNLEKTYGRLTDWLIQNCSDNHKIGTSSPPTVYARLTIHELRKHIAPKIPLILHKRRLDTGLLEADRKIAQLTGSDTQCHPANSQAGLYAGVVIGETTRHYLQSLNSRTVIAHKKDAFAKSSTPEIGRHYVIRYAKESTSISCQHPRDQKGMVRQR
jgi:DNA primase RepB-like protein